MIGPRIGITPDLNDEKRRYELPRTYSDAVRAAGGVPIVLPYGEREGYLEILDGIVLTGGAFDVPPERYGEARRAWCGPLKPERTDFEWALCEAALTRGIPVLGVCGGMQLLNVFCAGTLWQDLGEDLGNRGHEQKWAKDLPHHAVEVVRGTRLGALVGDGSLRVNSTHHQAVRDVGAGLVVSARAADGIVEAIELPTHPFALGVQWHPEAVARHDPRHAAIYRGLVEAAMGARR